MLEKPDFDSGWLSLSTGEMVINHSLNTTEVVVYMVGKRAVDGAPHQMEFGGFVNALAIFVNDFRGAYWHKLTSNNITVNRHGNDENWEYVRLRMWKIKRA